EDLIDELGIPPNAIEQVSVRERLELERREAAYRGLRPMPSLEQRTVILIDDGVATGASMEAAVAAVRQLRPAAVVVASPVGSVESCARLRRVADDVVCAETPEPFQAVGLWYQHFDQTSDDEVVAILQQASAFPRTSATAAPDTSQTSAATPAEAVRTRAWRLSGGARDYDALIDSIGDARFVLLGEATHGTHEFYRERAFITERLIAEKGFAAVAVEADWPDACRVNRYVRGDSGEANAVGALGDFGRFPAWMWRNADVLDFIGWLRAHNDTIGPDARAGFYGLDLYSLRASMEAVLRYLERVDPAAAARARARYGCFDEFAEDPQAYGYGTDLGVTPTCEAEAVGQLVEMQRLRSERGGRDGQVNAHLEADELFQSEQNARLVKNAAEYYRSMFRGRHEFWNLRDRHMA